LARGVSTASGALIRQQFPGFVVLLLIVSAQADHFTAAEVHARAASLSRELVGLIKANTPPGRGPVNVTLLNMPGITVARGIGAFTFANGLAELAHLASPEVVSVQIRNMATPSAPASIANLSSVIDVRELSAQLRDGSRIVVVFEGEPPRLRALTAETATNFTERLRTH
jgi:hypothetical protein